MNKFKKQEVMILYVFDLHLSKIILNWLSGVYEEVSQMKITCGEIAHMKVILAAG